MPPTILTLNSGSSSIKFALYAAEVSPQLILSGKIDRIGQANAQFTMKLAKDQSVTQQAIHAAGHGTATSFLIKVIEKHTQLSDIAAFGHRVVHGGSRYSEAQPVTEEMITELRKICPLAPNHLPAEIDLIFNFFTQFPHLLHIACFDTAFHHNLPRVAQQLPLPRRYDARGMRRYGFHGLSYTYLLEELERLDGQQAAQGKVILAHLGAGASLAAVFEGKSIDTTMSFTPTAGLVMATRTGDLDPGAMLYLLRNEKLSIDQVDDLINQRSGLLGVSGLSSDMRDLLAKEADHPREAEAVNLFCYQAKKAIGSFTAALGGLDTLVFAGGIGGMSPKCVAASVRGWGSLASNSMRLAMLTTDR
ncbi:MAG: acetate/propionate family kinase [Gemmatales bacterium]